MQEPTSHHVRLTWDLRTILVRGKDARSCALCNGNEDQFAKSDEQHRKLARTKAYVVDHLATVRYQAQPR